ncbi:hypothetical protein [uncultured Microbulbifer sp.]|uniref:hypothetical protein n=1 Tax=uncultured Microbulbifer sp. TaxID=348147 RepID=UPI0025E4188C|nr:hypothetical protein [uncultured Microbulbifer sp.]
MAAAGNDSATKSTGKPFHMRRWLSVQQAVDHLSALAEEPLTSDDLARLAEDRKLDLYWYRPGQKLRYLERPDWPSAELKQPLRVCPDNSSDWHAIVGILRQSPALPAEENDTPVLQDADGNLLKITFDLNRRPEPYSGRWYPNYSELVLKRSELERLESDLFLMDEGRELEPQLLLDVIWQLEQLALENGRAPGEASHDTAWLTRQLSQRAHLDPAILGRVLHAAERQHQSHH